MCLTLRVLTVGEKKAGFRSEVVDRIRGHSRSFVLRCAFFVVILILSYSAAVVGMFFALILVLSGTSTSSMCIFPGNSRAFRTVFNTS